MSQMSTATTHSEHAPTHVWPPSPRQPSSPRRWPRQVAPPNTTRVDGATRWDTANAAGPAFDVPAYLASAGAAKTITAYARGAAIFRQGEVGAHVCYIQSGLVKLSVVSPTGRDAVVAVLGPGEFFGEGCLAEQPLRMGRAEALAPSMILAIGKDALLPLLQRQPALAARFLSHMLARHIRMEEDLLDQLFHTSEQRLARTLLLLARGAGPDHTPRLMPQLSQETLADMVGTTRSRVNFFLNKFKKRGFIDYHGDRPMLAERRAPGLRCSHSPWSSRDSP